MFFRKISGAVSKTVVVNLLILVLGVFELVRTSPVLPPEYVPWLLLAIGVVNLVLRIFFTTEPVQK